MRTDIGLLILRVFPALMMLLSHGLPKIENFSTLKDSFPDPLGLGSSLSLGLTIFAEVVCAALLVLGVFTRFMAVPLLVTMIVAAFIVHSADPWSKKEFALLFAIPCLSLIFTGPGRFSLDRLFLKQD
jgi:putative oxidoreductase